MQYSEALALAAEIARREEEETRDYVARVDATIVALTQRVEALEGSAVVSPPPPPPPPPVNMSRLERGRAFLRQYCARGVNVTNWLDSPVVSTNGSNIVGNWGGNWDPIILARNIKRAGFDHVRLGVAPLNWGLTTSARLDYCKRAVDAFTSEDLTVWITGFHHGDDVTRDPVGTIERLRPEWRKYVQAFARYTNVHYEPLNEPQEMDGRALYNASYALYAESLDADPDGWVAYSPEAWSTVYAFEDGDDPVFNGERVVMVGHNYEPLAFTHSAQNFDGGAPERGPWTGGDVTADNYVYGRPVWRHIEQLRDYGARHDAALWMNEWGVIRNGSVSDARRAKYYKSFREALDRFGVSWCVFDWGGGFGVSSGSTLLPGFADALGLKSL